ncbi:aspartyl-phosphate phosphatase Spo0E family protein [Thermotalea metallivorans]|uniref:Spo0E like sporulation regulatory protein n=1 Tax=Thermotalea metallivorans TaxID=520762 RepID=A0A140L541_9FIRM|nr:aspartyl-phosphate phosphatase Spo0E family protein [Thermotalea metallivorans]KXG75666.1 hypothetical protein AN619_16620 [Thermotalea metallivorans]
MTDNAKERLAARINEVRSRLEQLMMDKNMGTDEEVVILSQMLDELIIRYYKESSLGEKEDVS